MKVIDKVCMWGRFLKYKRKNVISATELRNAGNLKILYPKLCSFLDLGKIFCWLSLCMYHFVFIKNNTICIKMHIFEFSECVHISRLQIFSSYTCLCICMFGQHFTMENSLWYLKCKRKYSKISSNKEILTWPFCLI